MTKEQKERLDRAIQNLSDNAQQVSKLAQEIAESVNNQYGVDMDRIGAEISTVKSVCFSARRTLDRVPASEAEPVETVVHPTAVPVSSGRLPQQLGRITR